jgi:hypothetical protein
MPQSIKSVPFSFIRFGAPADDGCSLDISYCLPAFAKYEAAFQFIVEGNRPTTDAIKLGICSAACVRILSFPDAIASILSYTQRINLSFQPTFYLYGIEIGGVSKAYGRAVTQQNLIDIFLDDWGLNITFVSTSQFTFLSNTEITIIINAASSSAEGAEVLTTSQDLYWGQGSVEAPENNIEMETGQCFRYCLLNADSTIIGCSNLFKVIDEDCFTSLLKYSCEENAFGFNYDGVFVNKVRLPFYLSRPNHPKKRVVYMKSNGANKLLSALVEKEYQLDTEQMPEVFHEAMAIALSHDYVYIKNSNIREQEVEVLESTDYNVKWNEDYELAFAPAEGKVKVAKYSHTNSNCGPVEDDIECSVPTDVVASDISETAATISWTAAVPAPAFYDVAIYKVTDDSFVTGASVSGLSATFSDLVTGTNYRAEVKSNCIGQQSIAATQTFATI